MIKTIVKIQQKNTILKEEEDIDSVIIVPKYRHISNTITTIN